MSSSSSATSSAPATAGRGSSPPPPPGAKGGGGRSGGRAGGGGSEAKWVRMAIEARRGWRELEAESRTELLELNGLLEVVRDAGRSSRDGLREAGADFELFDASAAHQRWPIDRKSTS